MNGITIIRFIDGSKRYKIEGDLWQYDYGQKLIIEGLDLPDTYEVHFGNKEVYGSTKTQIGTTDGVTIPDEYLISGEPLFVFIFLHDGTDDGETEYKAKIYVKRRPEPSDIEPTPQEQSAITQALAAFNKATDDIRNMQVESETLEPGSDATATWDGEKLTIGIPRGDVGPQGTTITSIALNSDYTLTVTTSDGSTFTTPPIRGEKGEPGDDYILTEEDKAEIANLVDIIDDTAGAGDTDKAWSADKISHELESAGSVKDVTVNGESIVDSESGVAEIPTASSVKYGLVKPGAGLRINGGNLVTAMALDSLIKEGTTQFSPIVPYSQHMATFYGLAKAAGDTTQSASSNAVGTYTEEAKVAIRNMIDATGESASVTVTGTDPVIQASRNTRYICGEILSLDFTPCASGICEVIFTSGSSVTVLTLPETIKMPEWFEVETNHTYEISVVDGVYGAVMVW